MKRRRRIVALALLMSLQGALLPGDGAAHPSSYCGHGKDGHTIQTRFERHWNDDRGRHWHENSHLRWGAWHVHPNEVKQCPR